MGRSGNFLCRATGTDTARRRLLASSDVVSLHVPLTAATEQIINAETLSLMRPGSVLVNTARGGLVDEVALDRALSDPAAPIGYAALDVFHREGPQGGSVLAGNPRCILTPHAAGMTRGAMAERAKHGSWKKFDRVMTKVRDVPPLPGDQK